MDRGSPNLLTPLHRLRSGAGVLRSPLAVIPLLAVLGVIVQSLAVGVHISWAISQLPMVMTIIAMAMAWSQLEISALDRDWKLSGGKPSDLTRAVFGIPCVVWWLTMVLATGLWLILRHADLVEIIENTADGVWLNVPGSRSVNMTVRPEEVGWTVWSAHITAANSPWIIAVWAFAMRWLGEWAFMARRNRWVGLALTMCVMLALRTVWRHWGNRFALMFAFRLQFKFPDTWSLAPRMLAGLWVGFGVAMLLLAVMGFVFRALALRRRARWWQEIS